MNKNKIMALASLAAMPMSVGATEKPNVIIIIADDLGWGDVSAYGNRTVSTPNIDFLAQNGACFTNGHASSATSTPSRYGLMTGMYPWRNDDAKILPGDAPLLVDTDQFTIGKMFQHAGYSTAAIGKWHLGMGEGKIDWNRQITPAGNAIGFDYTYLIAATVDRVPTVYVENGRVANLDPNDPISVYYEHPFEGEPTGVNNPELVKMHWSHGHQDAVINGIPRIGFMKGGKSAIWNEKTMAADILAKVKAYIDTVPQGKPFFLYYGLHEPHVPRVPASQFEGKSATGARGDVVIEADWCVGETMKYLKEKGLDDNTIVIFTSDNGPVLDDGYEDGASGTRAIHDPNGGLRGGKYSLFEAGTRVPFFIYWKGKIAHFTTDALVTQQDLLASFARMIGEKIPDGLDSQDCLDTFLGKSDKGRKSYVVEASGRLAYRSGRYALIPPYSGPKTNATGNELGTVDHYSLYDLTAEPTQQTDISAQNPKLVKKLKAEFLKAVGSHYVPTQKQEKLQ